jgi:hypothetical protein
MCTGVRRRRGWTATHFTGSTDRDGMRSTQEQIRRFRAAVDTSALPLIKQRDMVSNLIREQTVSSSSYAWRRWMRYSASGDDVSSFRVASPRMRMVSVTLVVVDAANSMTSLAIDCGRPTALGARVATAAVRSALLDDGAAAPRNRRR